MPMNKKKIKVWEEKSEITEKMLNLNNYQTKNGIR